MSNYRQWKLEEILFLQGKWMDLFMQTFKESIQKTIDWWDTDEAKIFYQERQERLTNFFNTSGIAEEWNKFAEERATAGADLTEQIYNYARDVRMGDDVIPFTNAERIALNELCDYSYELIKDVTEQQIKGIRDCLIQDYAEGRNSTQTALLEKLEQVQLEPIHTFSAEQRARMIARTETSRITNRATLMQFKRDGVKYVTYHCNSDCAVCLEHAGEEHKVLVDDALAETEIFHPNCSCTPIAVKDENGFYIPPEETTE